MFPAIIASKAVAKSNLVAHAMRFGIFAVLAIGSFLLIRKIVRRFQKNRYMSEFGKNNKSGRAVQYASQFYQAMISGHEWFNDWFGDGTDEKLIYSTAQEIHQDKDVSLPDVSQAYKRLYNRDLLIDLQKELDATQYKKFSEVMNSGLSGLSAPMRLITSRSATIFNEQFQPLHMVPANVNLGHSYESIISNQGTYHIFYYKGKARFVQDQTVKLYA